MEDQDIQIHTIEEMPMPPKQAGFFKQHLKGVIAAIIVLVLAVVLAIATPLHIIPAYHYMTAKSMMDQEDYTAAYCHFIESNGFADSEEILKDFKVCYEEVIVTYFDENGKADYEEKSVFTYSCDDNKEITKWYDKNGKIKQQLEEAYYDAHRRTLYKMSYEGNFVWQEYKYDTNGNQIESLEYDKDGKLSQKWVYNSHGDITHVIHYDENGDIYFERSYKYIYDENGFITSECTVDGYGLEIYTKYTYKFEYNDNGKIIGATRYDENGTKLKYQEFNDQGSKIAEEYYDSNGNISSRNEYNARILLNQYSYYSDGKISSIYKYDKNGYGMDILRYNQDGTRRYEHRSEYNQYGHVIYEYCYELGDDSTEAETITEYKYEYDKYGFIISHTSYINGKLDHTATYNNPIAIYQPKK